MVAALLNSLGFDRGADEPICMQFTNTVGSRHGADRRERLTSPEVLVRWLAKHHLVVPANQLDAPQLERAISLREAFFGLLSATAANRRPGEDDIEVLNGELAEALGKVELGAGLQWTLACDDPVERAFMLLALSAANLLTSPTASRIRECASHDCGWIFVDHSKNRSRRWCSMSDCGNQEKARRFQERRKAAAKGQA